jgi:hypothetical protein
MGNIVNCNHPVITNNDDIEIEYQKRTVGESGNKKQAQAGTTQGAAKDCLIQP